MSLASFKLYKLVEPTIPVDHYDCNDNDWHTSQEKQKNNDNAGNHCCGTSSSGGYSEDRTTSTDQY